MCEFFSFSSRAALAFLLLGMHYFTSVHKLVLHLFSLFLALSSFLSLFLFVSFVFAERKKKKKTHSSLCKKLLPATTPCGQNKMKIKDGKKVNAIPAKTKNACVHEPKGKKGGLRKSKHGGAQ